MPKPGGKISINHKDVKNVIATAHELDVPLPLTAQLFEPASERPQFFSTYLGVARGDTAHIHHQAAGRKRSGHPIRGKQDPLDNASIGQNGFRVLAIL